MREFKIRCSAIGQIMTNSRKKDEILGNTAKTYCKNWVKSEIYNRKKQVSTKYMEKGHIMEDESLDLIANYLDLGMLIKNEEYFESEWMTGTPDAILSYMIIDVKNSWDWSTFPLFENEIPNKDYYWQAQGYMHLTGRDKYKLIYVLSDTPIHLIEREAKQYCYNNGYEQLDADVYEDFVKKMTYPDIPIEHKIKIFDIEKNEHDIQSIMDRVEDCREFINQLKF